VHRKTREPAGQGRVVVADNKARAHAARDEAARWTRDPIISIYYRRRHVRPRGRCRVEAPRASSRVYWSPTASKTLQGKIRDAGLTICRQWDFSAQGNLLADRLRQYSDRSTIVFGRVT